MANIDLPPVEMDCSNQPVFVAPNIEDHPRAYFIHRREDLAQVSKITKLCWLHNFEPPRQRQFAIRVFFPEPAQGLARNDIHLPSISQFEIYAKPKVWRNASTFIPPQYPPFPPHAILPATRSLQSLISPSFRRFYKRT